MYIRQFWGALARSADPGAQDSGNLVGGWHKVEAAAMEVDGGDEVFGATKSTGGIFDPLNFGVDRIARFLKRRGTFS
jgi:hypothetical protein